MHIGQKTEMLANSYRKKKPMACHPIVKMFRVTHEECHAIIPLLKLLSDLTQARFMLKKLANV